MKTLQDENKRENPDKNHQRGCVYDGYWGRYK